VDFEIRPVRDTELDRYVSVLELAAGRHVTSEAIAEARETYELERVRREPAEQHASLEGGEVSRPS